MTSSFSPDQQRYIDTTGDGDVDTLVLSEEIPQEGDTDSVGADGEDTGISRILTPLEMEEGVVNFEPTPAPEKLTNDRKEVYEQLIKDDPKNSPWPEKIKELKEKYPELKDVNSLTQDEIDELSDEDYQARQSRNNQYSKSDNPDVKPASATSGLTIQTASKELKSFAVKTEGALTNFINLATKADGLMLDLPGEIKGVSGLITNAAKGYVGKIGDTIATSLISGISGGLDGIASKIFGAFKKFKIALPKVINAQSALLKPISAVFKGLNCLGAKVADALQGAIEDMLTAMVKNVLNPTACAINQFIGAVSAKINDKIDEFLTPLIGGISKVLGPVFKVKDILSKGVDLANKIGDFLNCQPKTSTDSKGTNEYKIDNPSGKKPKDVKEQQNIFNKALDAANQTTKFFDEKVNQADKFVDNISDTIGNVGSGVKDTVNNFEDEYGKWSIFGTKVNDAKDYGIGTDCDTGNIFKCGFPQVEFFGGDGIGGAGKVILGNFIDRIDPDDIYGDIRRTASIVGVEISDPGEEYSEEPLINFTDGCDQGYGAFGQVIIDKNVNSPTYGQITKVVILSEGENYPVDLPADVSDAVYISDIVVENPGTGYENATIDDDCLKLNTVDGQITSVEISCQKPYRSLPDIISLITNPGIGAVLRPIMTSTSKVIEQEVLESVDCVGKYPKPGEN